MILTLAVRVFQILSSSAALVLAAILVAKYGPGHAPVLFKYGVFCGVASILFSLVGVAAFCIEKLQGVVTLALDGMASLLLVAGGIAYAVTLKVGRCTSEKYMDAHEKTFFASMNKNYHTTDGNIWSERRLTDAEHRCKMAQADTAFIWFAFLCAVGCIVLSFFTHKRGSKSVV